MDREILLGHTYTPDNFYPSEGLNINHKLWLEMLTHDGVHLLVFDDENQVWNRMRQEDAEEIIRLLRELVNKC